MYIEAREIRATEGAAVTAVLDEFNACTPAHETETAEATRRAQPFDWSGLVLLTSPIWFVVAGPEIAGVVVAGYALNVVRKALKN